jgi:hypothetical protein
MAVMQGLGDHWPIYRSGIKLCVCGIQAVFGAAAPRDIGSPLCAESQEITSFLERDWSSSRWRLEAPHGSCALEFWLLRTPQSRIPSWRPTFSTEWKL